MAMLLKIYWSHATILGVVGGTMNMEDSVNKQYAILCAEILEPSMKKVALKFCVTTSDFYDTVHDLTFSQTRMMAEEAVSLGINLNDEDRMGYDRNLETVKSRQKLYRIAKRLLAIQDEEKKENADILFEPKVFDKCIATSMASTYLSIADMIGDRFFKTYPTNKIVRALSIEERSALSFSEFATYVCLYMALNRSSLEVLNKPITKESQKKRLRGRFRKIKDCLDSTALRDSLVAELVDLLAEANENEYARLMEGHCREYWLPEEKCGLKYLNYAMEKHHLDFPDIKIGGKRLFGTLEIIREGKREIIPVVHVRVKKENEPTNSDEIECEKAVDTWRKCRLENEKIQLFKQFFFVVLPVAEMMVQGIVPRNISAEGKTADNKMIALKQYIVQSPKVNPITKEYVKRKNVNDYVISIEEYLLAARTATVLERYVYSVIESVVDFLECLPESSISGEKTLAEYLSK